MRSCGTRVMIDRESDIGRLLDTFRGRPVDWVPLLELVIHSPTVEFVMGRPMCAGESGVYDLAQLVEYEKKFADRMRQPHLICEESPVLSTLSSRPEEYLELCRRTGMDAMNVFLSYTGQTGLSARGHVSDWSDLERMVPPPGMDYVSRHLQHYIDAVALASELRSGFMVVSPERTSYWALRVSPSSSTMTSSLSNT